MDTGFRIDVNEALLPQAEVNFGDFLSQAAERFAGSNVLGLSTFSDNVEQGGARLSADIGAQQLTADLEANRAKERAALNLGTLSTTRLGLGPALGADLQSIGQNLRRAQDEARLAPLQTFGFFSGLSDNLPFISEGFSPQSQLAELAGAFGNSFQNINTGAG